MSNSKKEEQKNDENNLVSNRSNNVTRLTYTHINEWNLSDFTMLQIK